MTMYSLPSDFPHDPPKNYTYEVEEFRRNILRIWCCNHSQFTYNGGNPAQTVWGFYNIKRRTYFAPHSSKRIGATVSLDQTSPYSAMPLLKLALDSADDTPAPAMIDSSTKDSMTITTPRKQEFSDFCAQRDAQNTLQLNVTKWCYMLCDALRHDYMKTSYARHKFLMPSSSNPAYHQECLDKIDKDICDYDFYIQTGRKYHKIMMNAAGSHSVHAFVDKKTGELYKAASIKQPAKGVRFDLRIITQREEVLEKCDWAGSYLYK